MLEVRHLAAGYHGLVALADVSFGVAAGEILVVAGANGAGKSTVLKTVAGVVPARSGTITFDGARIDHLAAHRITRLGMAFVPEERRLFPRMTVRDNLRLGSYLHRRRADREAPLATVLRLFPRLEERMDQLAATLSGGEQQMLAIGRALMTRPRLLMLDEPSQGIMPRLVAEIFRAIEEVRRAGITILLVEQRLTESLAIADKAIILRTGRIVVAGTAAEVRANPEVRSAYLGM
ncbi:MAG: ABC transporter ATP-binding protein [Rhodobacteraceae bacterium]|nr:ABC transporter ATP-binding protein [Paracoccaceae bacterium]